jgi:hypothetical protein
LVDGYLMNHAEGHECPRWDLSLLINRRYIFRPLDEIQL